MASHREVQSHCAGPTRSLGSITSKCKVHVQPPTPCCFPQISLKLNMESYLCHLHIVWSNRVFFVKIVFNYTLVLSQNWVSSVVNHRSSHNGNIEAPIYCLY